MWALPFFIMAGYLVETAIQQAVVLQGSCARETHPSGIQPPLTGRPVLESA